MSSKNQLPTRKHVLDGGDLGDLESVVHYCVDDYHVIEKVMVVIDGKEVNVKGLLSDNHIMDIIDTIMYN